jgi:hypothetical protein
MVCAHSDLQKSKQNEFVQASNCKSQNAMEPEKRQQSGRKRDQRSSAGK